MLHRQNEKTAIPFFRLPCLCRCQALPPRGILLEPILKPIEIQTLNGENAILCLRTSTQLTCLHGNTPYFVGFAPTFFPPQKKNPKTLPLIKFFLKKPKTPGGFPPPPPQKKGGAIPKK